MSFGLTVRRASVDPSTALSDDRSEEQQPPPQQPYPPPQQSTPQRQPAGPADMSDKLRQLHQLGELKAQGILTDAEFEHQKARILSN